MNIIMTARHYVNVLFAFQIPNGHKHLFVIQGNNIIMMVMKMVSFGQRLKELRELKGMSQEELARIFNLSQSTFAYYERNKKQPSQRTLSLLADYFGVSTDYLLGREANIDPGLRKASGQQGPANMDEIIQDLKYRINQALEDGYINEDEGLAYLEITRQQLMLFLGQRSRNK